MSTAEYQNLLKATSLETGSIHSSHNSDCDLEEDVIFVKQNKSAKTSRVGNCFRQVCSILLVILLFLALVLCITIIFMHMETKQEILNLTDNFKEVETKNNQLVNEMESLLLNINTTNLNMHENTNSLNLKNTILDTEKLPSKSNGLDPLSNSVRLLGSDLGKLKADVSQIKAAFEKYRGGQWMPVSGSRHDKSSPNNHEHGHH